MSDNVAGIHPRIIEAINNANTGYHMPYGDDDLSQRLDDAYSECFGTELAVIPCITGSAANALALSLMAKPFNSILVHSQSHIYLDECNAPEFFTGGARLSAIDGDNGKLALPQMKAVVDATDPRHSAQPSAISLTQTTELGSVYSKDEILSLTGFTKDNDLKVHMDGARFANAVAALDCHPGDITGKAGIDILSFGGTKNGCMAAEALILFDRSYAREARLRLKRAGHLLSKQRFLSAQLLAYIDNDLWLDNARRANEQSQKLAQGLGALTGVTAPIMAESNILFVTFAADAVKNLQDNGLAGYLYKNGQMRLCTSWATTDAEIERMVQCVAKAG